MKKSKKLNILAYISLSIHIKKLRVFLKIDISKLFVNVAGLFWSFNDILCHELRSFSHAEECLLDSSVGIIPCLK
jgi:hypothetical protein